MSYSARCDWLLIEEWLLRLLINRKNSYYSLREGITRASETMVLCWQHSAVDSIMANTLEVRGSIPLMPSVIICLLFYLFLYQAHGLSKTDQQANYQAD